MQVHIKDLTETGLVKEGTLPEGTIDLERDAPVTCPGAMRYRVKVMLVTDELLVDGTLAADVVMRCSRCDGRFEDHIENVPYHYDQTIDAETEYVDLTEDMREAMILAFPSYPLCDTTCKGLCPQCGANRNQSPCECEPPPDSRWSVLDGL